MPTPSHSFSPVLPPLVAGEGPRSPNPNATSTPPVIRFDQDTPGYGGLSHVSPHRVFYDGKLYPTAAHLFEAHRFLGRRNDLAKRVRKTQTLPELDALLRNISEHTRHDWEEILFSKMEDVLYRKLAQHPDLRELLLDTGIAEIVYADASDPFWGTGEHEEGENELGKTLMRVRERLRYEAAES
ncbi:DUF1768-domain-containing protein [Fomitiporia mediterranea MF3/22]|uniref:DUF1768-domain-containing protein n=1 Tax=Fomitiporia mediterranea (strain MF3/22) TaxID=694068 RepID=UPI0004408230|nr:DUF1768-domain-containing protein [Fomitiporia mediterranea MF3/22]EJD01691.1 DUF1768-domain-containing protein [Fomitiporia mediterranea MF3/22]